MQRAPADYVPARVLRAQRAETKAPKSRKRRLTAAPLDTGALDVTFHAAPSKSDLKGQLPLFSDNEGRIYYSTAKGPMGELKEWVRDRTRTLKAGELFCWVALPKATSRSGSDVRGPVPGDVIHRMGTMKRFRVVDSLFGVYRKQRSTGWVIIRASQSPMPITVAPSHTLSLPPPFAVVVHIET